MHFNHHQRSDGGSQLFKIHRLCRDWHGLAAHLLWGSFLFLVYGGPSCAVSHLLCPRSSTLSMVLVQIGRHSLQSSVSYNLIPINCGRHSDWGFLLEWCDIQCILPPSLLSWHWIVSRKCPCFSHSSFHQASLLPAAKEKVTEDWPAYASLPRNQLQHGLCA
jgi:hypothetical protein